MNFFVLEIWRTYPVQVTIDELKHAISLIGTKEHVQMIAFDVECARRQIEKKHVDKGDKGKKLLTLFVLSYKSFIDKLKLSLCIYQNIASSEVTIRRSNSLLKGIQ